MMRFHGNWIVLDTIGKTCLVQTGTIECKCLGWANGVGELVLDTLLRKGAQMGWRSMDKAIEENKQQMSREELLRLSCQWDPGHEYGVAAPV